MTELYPVFLQVTLSERLPWRHCALQSHPVTDERFDRFAFRRRYHSLRQISGPKSAGEKGTEFIFSGWPFSGRCTGRVFSLVMILLNSLDLSTFLTHDDTVRVVFNQYLLGQAVGALPFFLGKQLSVFLTMSNQINLPTAASFSYDSRERSAELPFCRGSALGSIR